MQMALRSCWLRLGPRRLCRSPLHTVAVQWRWVQRSDTKADRVELVAFHMHRAFRRRTQTMAELHSFQHGSDTSDPIPLKGNV